MESAKIVKSHRTWLAFSCTTKKGYFGSEQSSGKEEYEVGNLAGFTTNEEKNLHMDGCTAVLVLYYCTTSEEIGPLC